MNREQERAIEWDCAKALNQFYIFVDRGDYEAAADMYTEDGFWTVGDTELHGRQAIGDSLRAGLPNFIVQHLLQNIVVDVVDEDHADAVLYVAIYRYGKAEVTDGTVPIVGPWSIGHQNVKMVHTNEGWKVARRDIHHKLLRAE
jgi:ketosteroid isomerase-like protein